MGGRKKLTSEQEQEIVLRIEKETYQQVAEAFGVSVAKISELKKEHVDGRVEERAEVMKQDIQLANLRGFYSFFEYANNAYIRLRWMLEFFNKHATLIPASEDDIKMLATIIKEYGDE